MDKEGFAIVTTFKRLPYLLWGGVAIHCRHRNLAYICGVNGVPTSKAVSQRLEGWRVFLGQFPYTIVHIPGDENCWVDLLSHWVHRAFGSNEWTDERVAACDAVRLRVSEAVALNYVKPGFSVMMFPDASDKFRGGCITNVPTVEYGVRVAVEDMGYEPSGFLSGPSRDSQER